MKKVTAAIILHEGKVLITQRGKDDKLPFKWEFPGGKIEPGETPEECLRRELKEELCIEVEIGEFFGSSVYHYEHGSVELFAYYARQIGGEMKLMVHYDARWVAPDQLPAYDFSPADIPFVERLAGKA